MRIKKITAASSYQGEPKSLGDMIEAFQDKLAEFEVESTTDLACKSNVQCEEDISCKQEYIKGDKSVEIRPEDNDLFFKDEGGGFGETNAVYSLAEIKEMWNNDYEDDPVVGAYASFDDWWKDTYNNYLVKVKQEDIESKTDVSCSDDVYIDDEDYNTYYLDTNGMFGQDEHSKDEAYSLGEIKHYWNTNKDSDWVLQGYASFSDWWNDLKQSMEEITEDF